MDPQRSSECKILVAELIPLGIKTGPSRWLSLPP